MGRSDVRRRDQVDWYVLIRRRLLGHSTAAFTTRVSSRLLLGMQEYSAAQLEERLLGGSSCRQKCGGGAKVISLPLAMVVRACFDGSQSDPAIGPRILAVAGFVWEPEPWKRFEREWQALLAKYGLPHFHMAAFESSQGPYKDWSPKKHQEALNDFLGVITRTASYCVGVAVVIAHHEALEEEFKAAIPSPYRSAATMCMGGVGNWIEGRIPSERAEYIFEYGDEGQGPMRDQIAKLMESATWREVGRIHGIRFGSKKNVPGVQPADILAYETVKVAQRKMGYREFDAEGKRRADRYPLRTLLEAIPSDSAFMDSAALHNQAIALRSPSDKVIELRRAIHRELRRGKKKVGL